MTFKFLDGDDVRTIQVVVNKGHILVDVAGEPLDFEIENVTPNCLLLHGRNCTCCVYHAKTKGKQYVSVSGETYCFQLPKGDDGDQTRCRTSGDGNTQSQVILSAPMPGNLLQVNVQEGDLVEAGQCLAVIEAMKMETGLHASIQARVKKIYAEAGRQVEAGERLIILEQEDNIEQGEERPC